MGTTDRHALDLSLLGWLAGPDTADMFLDTPTVHRSPLPPTWRRHPPLPGEARLAQVFDQWAVSPDSAALWQEATLAQAQGWVAQAEDALTSLCLREPDWALPRGALGTLLANAGRLKEAAEHLARAVQLDGGDAEWLWRLGLVRLELGEAGPACAALQLATGLAPDSAQLWEALGRAAGQLGDAEMAESAQARATGLGQRRPGRG